MKQTIKLLDVVALLEDIPKEELVRGQMGTVVHILKPGIYEVEFSGEDGKTYAIADLKEDQLLGLHSERRKAA